jgi:hypothetical protein
MENYERIYSKSYTERLVNKTNYRKQSRKFRRMRGYRLSPTPFSPRE